MEILRVLNESLAKKTEKFIFEAIKPNGFADMGIPVPSLKDRLVWSSWANLMRKEQPTIVAMEGEKIVGVLVGEPIETTFDIGESEIQDIIILPEYQTPDLTAKLMKPAIKFYEENKAKQTHVWCVKEAYDNGNLNLKCKVAIEQYDFEFKGFERVSKWTGKKIVKLELYY